MSAGDEWARQIERLWQAGDFHQVESLCRTRLESGDEPLAHYILGKLYVQAGNVAEGIRHLESHLRTNLTNADAFLTLGKAQLTQKQWHAAAENLHRAAELNPKSTDAQYHLGLATQNLGNLEEAAVSYRNALALQPGLAEAHNNLGGILQSLGDVEGAVLHLSQAVELQPDNRAAAENLAGAYIKGQDYPKAAALLRVLAQRYPQEQPLTLRAAAVEVLAETPKAAKEFLQLIDELIPVKNDGRAVAVIGLKPNDLKLLAHSYRHAMDAERSAQSPQLWRLAVLLQLADADQEREACLAQLAEREEHAPALRELGHIAFGHKQWNDAEAYYRRSLRVEPNDADTLNGLAAIQIRGKAVPDVPEAIRLLERAIALQPEHEYALQNLGLAYLKSGDTQAAAILRRAVAAAPQNAEAHNNLALALLSAGELNEGWAEYEWRLKSASHRHRPFPYPVWTGEPLAGKTILVHAEQGLGDEILFASCLPDLLVLVGTCIVECDRRLVPLFARSFPQAHVVARIGYDQAPEISALPTPDYQISMGSLPGYFRRTLTEFPDENTFLKADPNRVTYWRSRLEALGPGPKIGFSWRSGHTGYGRPTYLELVHWRSIFEYTEDCIFVDLQYTETTAERTALEQATGRTLFSFPDIDLRNNLDDLAALLCALDLIITIGNVNAPLAGALGRPVWRLCSVLSGDAMRLGAETYPWFSSMTPIQQFSPIEPQLLHMLGAWLRRFADFGQGSDTVDLAAQGYIAKALSRLRAKRSLSKNETALFLYLFDLCFPDAPLPESIEHKAGMFGTIISGARTGGTVPYSEEAPIDALFYLLTSVSGDQTEKVFARIRTLLEQGIPIPEIYAASRKLVEITYKSRNVAQLAIAEKLLLSKAPVDSETRRIFEFAYFYLADWPKAWGHAAIINESFAIAQKWQGENINSIDLFVDGNVYWFYPIWMGSCLDALAKTGRSHIVKAAPEILPLLSRTFPTLRFVAEFPDKIDDEKGSRWTTIERLAGHFLTDYTALEPRRIYFCTDLETRRKWRNALRPVPRPLVAVCRRISPNLSQAFDRSPLPFSLLSLNGNDAHLCYDNNELAALSCVPQENDLDGFAALLSAVDLLVTDNSSIALLGAAVGTTSLFVRFPPGDQIAPPPFFPDGGRHHWYPNLHFTSNPPDLVGEILSLLRPPS